MPGTVKGRYNGGQILLNWEDQDKIAEGQEVVITFVIPSGKSQPGAETEDPFLAALEKDTLAVPTGRSVEEIDRYVKELRANDRI